MRNCQNNAHYSCFNCFNYVIISVTYLDNNKTGSKEAVFEEQDFDGIISAWQSNK